MHLTLVLISAAGLGGLAGCGNLENNERVNRDVYANMEACKADWGNPGDCEGNSGAALGDRHQQLLRPALLLAHWQHHWLQQYHSSRLTLVRHGIVHSVAWRIWGVSVASRRQFVVVVLALVGG